MSFPDPLIFVWIGAGFLVGIVLTVVGANILGKNLMGKSRRQAARVGAG